LVPLLSIQVGQGIRWLVQELDQVGGVLDEPTVRRLLSRANLTIRELAQYIEEKPHAYAWRCVVRREHYEMLVLTWRAGQGSVAHDHCGSLCGLKVIQGSLVEQLFESGPDGQVRQSVATTSHAGAVLVDPGVVIHSLGNEPSSPQTLVTLHIYSPPLPEVRRYAVTQQPPAEVFTRRPAPGAKTIAILGGGFTGTMALANLLRFGNESAQPLHLILIDRQPAIGEGIAYRTNDARHLLNVPAARMSALPDLPNDFLQFAQSKDRAVKAGDFLPRKIYGQYVRQRLLELAERASNHLSVEILRDHATNLSRRSAQQGWTIQTSSKQKIDCDVAIVTVGHRPPDDPFGRRWTGPRTRFVADPWAALVLSQIGPNEPVLLLGSGLTAVDAILTLDRPDRTAPVLAVSRRGLMPLPHAPAPMPPIDLSAQLATWLDPTTSLKIRRVVADLRRQVEAAHSRNQDWRQVIDALRPAIAQLWQRLDLPQRSRFLTHLRPLWEIHRHRMAPQIAERISQLRAAQMLQVIPGVLKSATADADGVEVTLCPRGQRTTRPLRVNWVINCTGPGIQNRHTTHPLLRALMENGILCDDELALGIQTDEAGRAINANGTPATDLLLAGTLRKATLWESTAVPELRHQAQTVAKCALTQVEVRCR